MLDELIGGAYFSNLPGFSLFQAGLWRYYVGGEMGYKEAFGDWYAFDVANVLNKDGKGATIRPADDIRRADSIAKKGGRGFSQVISQGGGELPPVAGFGHYL